MTPEEELYVLYTTYWKQQERLRYLESEVLLLSKQEERMTQLETLLRDYSAFAARLHTASLSPELWHERDALQARVWELLEGKERPGK